MGALFAVCLKNRLETEIQIEMPPTGIGGLELFSSPGFWGRAHVSVVEHSSGLAVSVSLSEWCDANSKRGDTLVFFLFFWEPYAHFLWNAWAHFWICVVKCFPR